VTSIRIAQLSTSSLGGAAVAARRLSDELNKRDIGSELIHSRQSSTNKIKNLNSKIVTSFQRTLTREMYGIATPFSLSKVDRNLLLRTFDVLHIHNWYNLLSLEDLQYFGSRIPIMFTMHDERLLTGGCHTTLGCKNFMRNCNPCPAVFIGESHVSRSKKLLSEILLRLPVLSVITPSRWMREQWQLAHPNFAHLANYIPNIIEYPIRRRFTFDPSSVLKIVFISADISTPVKGLATLLNALAKFNLYSKVRVDLVGKFDLKSATSHENVRRHGALTSQEVFQVMRQSHLLVVPSFSENSPNVIAEAQLLGLPVLASNVGGNSELIDHGITGFLAEPNEDSIGSALTKLIEKPNFREISENAIGSAESRWDNSRNTLSHIDAYRRVTSL
jgi:glycosyltransferase involved in cell wall biosynthesis